MKMVLSWFSPVRWLVVVGCTWGLLGSAAAWGQAKQEPGPAAAARKDGKPAAGAEKAAPGTATLKGKLIVPPPYTRFVSPGDLVLKLSEQIQMNDPPVPENFNEMTPDQQLAWWNGFQQSEAGKKFIADEEARFKNRRQFDVRVEDSGDFTAYDVPAGVWDLRGAVTRQAETYETLFEVFGELSIEESVEEVALGEMTIMATPLMKAGDPLPPLDLKGDSGPISVAAAKGKHCLITFWTASEPSSSFFQKNLQAAFTAIAAKHPVQLFSIAFNQDAEAFQKFVTENGKAGVYGDSSWEAPLAESFGVRSIPWLILLDKDGKVLASDRDLGVALRTSGLDIQEILLRKIEGREIPVARPPADAAGAAGSGGAAEKPAESPGKEPAAGGG